MKKRVLTAGLLFLGIAVFGLPNWRNNKAAYWIAAFIITAEDIGFLLFLVMHGRIEFPASIIGPGLWIIGLIFTTIAYRSAAQVKQR